MKVYLVQHGPCIEKTRHPEQPLSEEGKQLINKTSRFVSLLKLEIDYLWHSEKLRAKQTAEILASGLNVHGVIESHTGLTPLDPVEPIVQLLHQLKQNIMLVGHMPFMGNMVNKLVGNELQNFISFVPGTIVCLEQNKQQWNICWMLTPEIINKVMQ